MFKDVDTSTATYPQEGCNIDLSTSAVIANTIPIQEETNSERPKINKIHMNEINETCFNLPILTSADSILEVSKYKLSSSDIKNYYKFEVSGLSAVFPDCLVTGSIKKYKAYSLIFCKHEFTLCLVHFLSRYSNTMSIDANYNVKKIESKIIGIVISTYFLSVLNKLLSIEANQTEI